MEEFNTLSFNLPQLNLKGSSSLSVYRGLWVRRLKRQILHSEKCNGVREIEREREREREKMFINASIKLEKRDHLVHMQSYFRSCRKWENVTFLTTCRDHWLKMTIWPICFWNENQRKNWFCSFRRLWKLRMLYIFLPC